MDLLVPGCRVRLTDLVSRSDLNGEEALLLLWIDDQQRWAVRLVNKAAEELKVKPANVVRSPSGFDCLNEDALLLALVRTSTSSHQPLFATNWRIRKVIHSPEFFRSRLRLGFANVAVTLSIQRSESTMKKGGTKMRTASGSRAIPMTTTTTMMS